MKREVDTELNEQIKNLLCAALVEGFCVGDTKSLRRKIETWACLSQMAPIQVRDALVSVLENKETAEAEYILKILKKFDFHTVSTPN